MGEVGLHAERGIWPGRSAGMVLTLAASLLACAARAEPPSAAESRAFIEKLWPAAQVRGISRTVFERATADFLPDPEVIALATFQPEHTKPAGDYVKSIARQARIDTGRQHAARHAQLLERIEAAYGVDRHILLAIWGVESAYGTEMGSRNVVRSLATLALADVRRAPFWTRELIAALRMLQDGAVRPEKLVGSWAGAVGHTQFIPSTYNARAVDFDKDGRRDIWETVADALASSANYLRASGWVTGSPWGFEVALPAQFDFAWSAPGRSRTLAEWQAAGVKAVAGRGDPASGLSLQLLLPAGARGPAFLVSDNFRVLLKYNQSASYALAVGHLADRIAGGPAISAAWPADETPLTRTEREELQSLLASWGLDTGGLDGIIGDRTRAAIRTTQRTLSLVEDGHPSLELLRRLRDSGGP
jgi:membrane-bound lytic murein transglycosylase B